MRILLGLVALLLLPVPAIFGRPPNAVGHYKDWNGDLNGVDILCSFHLSGYTMIVVLPIDTRGIEIPTDNTRLAVEKILGASTQHFAEELDNSFPDRMKVKAEPGLAEAHRAPGVLFLRTKFTEMDPGIASTRAISFGTGGATHISMSGELTDAITGTPLLRFETRNTHGKGGLFQRYGTQLEENEEQIADSLATLIKTFYP